MVSIGIQYLCALQALSNQKLACFLVVMMKQNVHSSITQSLDGGMSLGPVGQLSTFRDFSRRELSQDQQRPVSRDSQASDRLERAGHFGRRHASIETSNKSLPGAFQTNTSESASQRGTHRSRSPRRNRQPAKGEPKKPETVQIIFKAIAERPQLDSLTREERVREKLKFFNLEMEDLEESRKRIAEKVMQKSTRFGSLSSNMQLKPDAETTEQQTMYNPFQEMMAIEEEFGCIFPLDQEGQLEEAKANSRWYPFLECISKKKKQKEFAKIVEDANKRKEQRLKQKQLEMIKQQIARGVKNVNTAALQNQDDDENEGGDKVDVQKMIAEVQRKQQNQRMEDIVEGINNLCEKSVLEDRNLGDIKDFIHYKYPSCPSNDASGHDIYKNVFSRIDARWQFNELEEMKQRSQIKRRQDSIARRKINNFRQKSINVQDMQIRNLESPDFQLSPGISQFNTSRLNTHRTAKVPQKDLVDIVGTMSIQPDVVNRLHTTKNAQARRNFDLFTKENAVPRVSNKRASPRPNKRLSPLADRNLTRYESFFGQMTDTLSQHMQRDYAQLKARVPAPTPITDSQWKEHLAIKKIGEINGIKVYTHELAEEMRVYCLNRLENVQNNVSGILNRLKKLKPKKVFGKKRSRSQRENTNKQQASKSGPTAEGDRSISHNADLEAHAGLQSTKGGEQEREEGQEKSKSQGVTEYSIPDETEGNKEGDESCIGEDSNLRGAAETSRMETRYDEHEGKPSQVKPANPSQLLNEPNTAATERVLDNASMEVTEQQTEPHRKINSSESQQYQDAIKEDGQAVPIVMKTINDYEFDVRLITKFNKRDYKKTKLCRESLKSVIQALGEGPCFALDFGWSNSFRYSIFQEEVLEEIVPILMVLKKIAQTPIQNTSLWIVLARRLVNMKVQRFIIDPDEIPSLLVAYVDAANRRANQESRSGTYQRIGEGERNADIVTQPPSPCYADSLYRAGRSTVQEDIHQQADPSASFKLNRLGQEQVKAGELRGSATTFVSYKLNSLPVEKNVGEAQRVGRLPTAGGTRRRFDKFVHLKSKEYDHGTLPNLTDSPVGRATPKGRATPFRVDRASMKKPIFAKERLIKTSHMRHRSRVVSGEVNEAEISQQPVHEAVDNNLSYYSPPAIDNSIFVSVNTPQRGKSRQNRRATFDRTMRTEATLNGNWRQHWSKDTSQQHFNPVSVYNDSVQRLGVTNASTEPGMTPTQTRRRKSVRMRTVSRAQPSTNQGNQRSTAATVKKDKPLSRQHREKLAELILAKKIAMRQEHRVPSTRHRGASTHQTMLNAIGYRSFGSSYQQQQQRKTFRNMLPNCNALKAIRAGSFTCEKLATLEAAKSKADQGLLSERVD